MRILGVLVSGMVPGTDALCAMRILLSDLSLVTRDEIGVAR